MPFTTGMDLGGLRADLGDIPLGQVDDQGVAWTLQSLEGWDGSEVRATYTDRESDHGSWASPVYLGSRPITVGGTVTAADRAALEDALERLRSAAALTDTTLVVYELTAAKQATVRRSGKPLFAYVTDRTATFSVMVTAADPRRYGTDLLSAATGLPMSSGGLTFPTAFPAAIAATSVAGETTATNSGQFETRPVLTIAGPVSAPKVFAQYSDGTVRQLTFSQNLASGDQLVIDTDAHTVILNNAASRRRFLTVISGWPTIPASDTVTYRYRTTGAYNSTTTLTVTWRSAWM